MNADGEPDIIHHADLQSAANVSPDVDSSVIEHARFVSVSGTSPVDGQGPVYLVPVEDTSVIEQGGLALSRNPPSANAAEVPSPVDPQEGAVYATPDEDTSVYERQGGLALSRKPPSAGATEVCPQGTLNASPLVDISVAVQALLGGAGGAHNSSKSLVHTKRTHSNQVHGAHHLQRGSRSSTTSVVGNNANPSESGAKGFVGGDAGSDFGFHVGDDVGPLVGANPDTN